MFLKLKFKCHEKRKIYKYNKVWDLLVYIRWKKFLIPTWGNVDGQGKSLWLKELKNQKQKWVLLWCRKAKAHKVLKRWDQMDWFDLIGLYYYSLKVATGWPKITQQLRLKSAIFHVLSWKFGFNIIWGRGIRIRNRILDISIPSVPKLQSKF